MAKNRFKTNIFKTFTMCMMLMLGVVGCTVNPVALKGDVEIITESTKYKESETRTPLKYYSFTLRNWSETTYPLGGFVGPTNFKSDAYGRPLPPAIRQEVFDDIAEAGVNLIIGGTLYQKGNPECDAAVSFEMAANAGISMLYLQTGNPLFNLNGNPLGSVNTWVEYFEELMQYPSFGGMYCKDEPSQLLFPAIATVNEHFKKVQEAMNGAADNLFLYWNAFPMGARGSQYSGVDINPISYEQYIDEYVATNPQALLYDNYPFVGEPETISNNWFENMSVIKKKAEENNMPWWAFTQAGGRWFDDGTPREPTESEFIWDMNTMVAYGAKGIIHYMLMYPGPDHYTLEANNEGTDYSHEALIDPYGSRNKYWYYAKKGAQQIRATEEYLMSSSNVGLVVRGDTLAPIPKQDILGDGWRELKGIAGDDAIVGCFDYKGKTMLYVVSNPYKESSDVLLEFTDRYGYDVIQRGEKISVAGTKLPLKMAGGEGVLVVLK